MEEKGEERGKGPDKAARLKDLERRAKLAEDGYSRAHPYETLGLLAMEEDPDADADADKTVAAITQGDIRAACASQPSTPSPASRTPPHPPFCLSCAVESAKPPPHIF